MNLGIRTIALAALCAAPVALAGQDLSKYTNFTVGSRTIQVHGFVSQGFGYSDDNNYLTMKTSQGSFAFTDAGLNMSTQLTDKFRVGAQIYVRDIGNLSKWHPQLDWATADYKFKDWFGIRGGVVFATPAETSTVRSRSNGLAVSRIRDSQACATIAGTAATSTSFKA